ncbi:MAG: C10 family peptidase [Tannerella sp.]|nr:C10 family peptidase [Tannerella sp.]
MKYKILLLAALIIPAMTLQAGNVSVNRALRTAENCFHRFETISLRNGGKDRSLKLAYTAKPESVTLRSSAGETAYYYVFNFADSSGFIIISGDDRAYPVLGYSFRGAFDRKTAPPVFLLWLQNYENEISAIVRNNPDLPVNPQWERFDSGNLSLRQAAGPLGTAEWDQFEPYNLMCPKVGGNRTVTGSVATAMAILMKYNADHGFAAVGTGSHSYVWNGQTLKVDFGTYDWANMPNTTSEIRTETQRNAVSKLMYHCGVSIEASYRTGATSTNPSNVALSLVTFFGYDARTEYIYKSQFTDSEWETMLKAEIDAKRPVIYRGAGDVGGHAFICEGYTDNGEYTFNWGWSGYCNGNFRLTALNPGGIGYMDGQGMIIGSREAEIKAEEVSQLRLTYSNTNTSKGLVKDVPNVVQNQPFTMASCEIANTSYDPFKGLIAVALTDSSGKVKEILGQSSLELQPCEQSASLTFNNCTVTQTLSPTDQLRMVTSTDKETTWKPVHGSTGITDCLPVTSHIAVTSVLLNASEKTLTEGGSYQFTATVKPDNATDKSLSWSSSDPAVASVDHTGLVTAKSAGDATITVTTTDGGKTADCVVTVKSAVVRVTGVTLNKTSGKLAIDENLQLIATVKPDNASNKEVRWTSSDSTIASVDSTGLVTANLVGNATITATTVDGSKKATCTIMVTLPAIPTNGLVAYFPFNGNANDASGNGNHGTVHGATLTTDRFGKANNAYYFDGNSAYIDGSFKNNLARFTITLWFNVASVPPKGEALMMMGVICQLTGVASSEVSIVVWPWEDGVGSYSSIYGTVATCCYSPNNLWYFAVLKCSTSYNDEHLSYMGHTEGGAYYSWLQIESLFSNYIFGKPKYDPDRRLLPAHGSIDDVLIYNRLLNDDEIDALFARNTLRTAESAGEKATDLEETPQSDIQARISDGKLYVNSPVAERITLYSVSGSVMYSADKPVGTYTFDVSGLPRGIFILRTSTGSAAKVIR